MTCAVSAFIVVDLPAPFGPSSPTHVPYGTSRSRPSTAVSGPNRFTRPRMLIANCSVTETFLLRGFACRLRAVDLGALRPVGVLGVLRRRGVGLQHRHRDDDRRRDERRADPEREAVAARERRRRSPRRRRAGRRCARPTASRARPGRARRPPARSCSRARTPARRPAASSPTSRGSSAPGSRCRRRCRAGCIIGKTSVEVAAVDRRPGEQHERRRMISPRPGNSVAPGAEAHRPAGSA